MYRARHRRVEVRREGTSWLTALLRDVGVETLNDLRTGNTRWSPIRMTCRVGASCAFPGTTPNAAWREQQRVVDAVRASMAIPFYFRPAQVTTQNDTATWIDGGLFANLTITVFRPH